MGLNVISQMHWGLFTGTITRKCIAGLTADDWRAHNPEFQEPKLSKNLELVERLRAIGKRHGCLPGQVAVAWTLRHPAVTGAIVGARNPDQVQEIAAGPEIRLTEQEIKVIESGSDTAGDA